MSGYFDHARCPHCKIAFDPERVATRGDAFACPNCGSQLSVTSLFGLAAHLDEDAPEDLSLDDLVPSGSRGGSSAADDDDEPPSTLKLLEDFRKSRK